MMMWIETEGEGLRKESPRVVYFLASTFEGLLLCPLLLFIYLFVLDGNVIALLIRDISASFIFSPGAHDEC